MAISKDRRKKKIESIKERLAIEQGLLRKEERKEETRRKILVGSFYLENARKNPGDYKKLVERMDEFLTRDHDRKVFDLPPIEKME
jgi:hypothetical protein